jgi:CubicO group peptidase (beta-lactamase class C family)
MIQFKISPMILFFIPLFAVFGCNKSEGYDSSTKYASAIEESRFLIDSILKSQKIPGIDIAVSIHGETVWSEGFGFADLEHESYVIAGKTRFRIGSVSKPITSSALGRLIDKGKINLDTSIYTYVPYFPRKKFPISVRQVGSHLGGIRHYRNNEFLNSSHYNSVKSGLEIFQNDPLIYKPGTRYSYSSYGYNLLSAVIEGASGEEFLSFMQSEIFSPLNMEFISADINDSIILYRSSFYDVDSLGNFINAPYVDNSYKWAGGGFIASTSDLIRFGEAHMKPGFLSEETLVELTTSQVSSNGDSTGYGIGWKIMELDSLNGYGHGGGSVGGITRFKIFPDDELVFVILSNSTRTNYGNIPNKIIRKFLSAK